MAKNGLCEMCGLNCIDSPCIKILEPYAALKFAQMAIKILMNANGRKIDEKEKPST